MFLSKPASYMIVRSRDIFCRKMTVGYLQVQTPLACVHFIQTAKCIHGNDPQRLLLQMPGQITYLFCLAVIYLSCCNRSFFTKKYLLSFHLQQFTQCVPPLVYHTLAFPNHLKGLSHLYISFELR